MDFNEATLKERLAGKLIGRQVHFLEEIGSTNDYAFKLAHDGAPEGAVVIAESQTSGKGRMNRVWQSPPRRNLYTSIVFRPPVEPAAASQITLVAGVAAAQTLASYCPGRAAIKWPNDVMIGGRKACGILTEMKTAGNGVEFVVVGIGVNINIRKEELDEAFREHSTSVREEVGGPVSRLDMAVQLYENLERLYARFIREGFAGIRQLWLDNTDMVGKAIRVAFRDDIKEGRVAGIDHDGALLLGNNPGETVRIIAGDATIIKH
ncbi:MAG: biotin--[acetyl-CoA-carboxylase] ligase [Deltaproteobacteria bacterium]|nr:biotin--[acetyl-CoA-carboxylase] ligase [Deltaproteobacteria bacterium]